MTLMGSVPSTDSRRVMIMPWGITELKRSVASSLGVTFPAESLGGNSMSAMPPPNDAGDDMVCDPSMPLPTVNGITMTENSENVNNDTNPAPSVRKESTLSSASCSNEFLSKYGALHTEFTEYASFVLNVCAGGDPENAIPDGIMFCLSTFVRFLQQQLDKITEAAMFELTKSKEAHEAQRAQLFLEFDKKLIEALIVSETKIRQEVINWHIEEVAKCLSPTQCQLRCVQDTFQWELQHCKRKAQKMQVQPDEKMTKNSKTDMSQDVESRDMITQKVEYLEVQLRHSQEAAEASDQDVQHLRSRLNEEKEKAAKELKSETDQLKSKCLKLEAQLLEIEQKAAQESLTSGSYADNHANPSMLEDACKSVDKATDNLMRLLHGVSITSDSSAKWKDQLEQFLGDISSASLANFSSLVQVKYAWGHWICYQMFDDFEHVFFDVDDGMMTSPLDPKIHALQCFQTYQQKKEIPSLKLFEGCEMFRAFCISKYSSVFPLKFVKMALYPQSAYRISCDGYGRFSGDEEIFHLFLDVAKAIWLLHQLSFSFDPPASILRMAVELPFDVQYHESVIHDADNNGMPQEILLMIRPAFRLRNTIIRSRVFLFTSGSTSKMLAEPPRR